MTKISRALVGGTLMAAVLLPASVMAAATPARCYGGDGNDLKMETHLRYEEAIRIAGELNSRVMNALDKVLAAEDNPQGAPPSASAVQSLAGGGNNWAKNLQYVIDLQANVWNNNGNVFVIESFPITSTQDFINAWTGLARLYKYRKRNITNYIPLAYSDVNCLREIKVYGIGQTFGTRTLAPDGTLPPLQSNNPPWLTTRNFVDFDRFTITWTETAPGVFKVKDLVQETEGHFPLPDGASGIPDPTGNNVTYPFAPLDRSPFSSGPGSIGNVDPAAPAPVPQFNY